jgi:hypothetical protein
VWGRSSLEVVASDTAGNKIGSSAIDLSSLTRIANEALVVIFCKEREACDDAQSQISFSGSENEVSEKGKNFKFLTLQTPRERWLDYAPAAFIVIAGTLSDWNTVERRALEAYTRRGGHLILLEKESRDPTFLSAYRTGSIQEPALVGRGKLFRVPGLQTKTLGSLFTGKLLSPYGIYPPSSANIANFDPLRQEFAVSFSFPRLRWFLVWLVIYIFIVGVGNFSLLNRLRRLEWGWITTAGVAVVFAIGLYFVSSANRPKQITLDNLAVYWMDDKSPNAWESIPLRVSSPERQELSLTVGDDAVLTSGQPTREVSADIATEITEKERMQPGWQIQLGPPFEVEIPMLRWSYSDLDFETFHVFTGTVTLTDRRLKNGTGQQFREAMYLDISRNEKYLISNISPGEEIDLNRISSDPIWERVRMNSGADNVEFDPAAITQRKPARHLKDLPYNEFSIGESKHLFVGLSDTPIPPVSISGHRFVQNRFAVTVVALTQP